MSYYRWREGHLQAKDTMNEHINAALESGVTPDQFRAEYEKRQSTAVGVYGHTTIKHSPATNAVYVALTRKDGIRAEIPLSPESAIRWGESLAAAGRAAQK